jgi:hypothetical protein
MEHMQRDETQAGILGPPHHELQAATPVEGCRPRTPIPLWLNVLNFKTTATWSP